MPSPARVMSLQSFRFPPGEKEGWKVLSPGHVGTFFPQAMFAVQHSCDLFASISSAASCWALPQQTGNQSFLFGRWFSFLYVLLKSPSTHGLS